MVVSKGLLCFACVVLKGMTRAEIVVEIKFEL